MTIGMGDQTHAAHTEVVQDLSPDAIFAGIHGEGGFRFSAMIGAAGFH